MITLDQILANAKEIGPTRGIYFLIKDQQVIYVGQSLNYYSRFAEHCKNKSVFRSQG